MFFSANCWTKFIIYVIKLLSVFSYSLLINQVGDSSQILHSDTYSNTFFESHYLLKNICLLQWNKYTFWNIPVPRGKKISICMHVLTQFSTKTFVRLFFNSLLNSHVNFFLQILWILLLLIGRISSVNRKLFCYLNPFHSICKI